MSLPPPLPAVFVAVPSEPLPDWVAPTAEDPTRDDDVTTTSEFGFHSFVPMIVSTVIHAVALLLLSLVLPAADPPPASSPLEITTPPTETEVEFEPLEPVHVTNAEPAPADDSLVDAPTPDVPAPEPLAPTVELAEAEITTPDFDPTTVDLDDGETLAVLQVRAGRTGGGDAGGPGGGFDGEVGRRLAQAGGKSGAIQVSLVWNNFNDLDLHLIAPSGEHIFFGHPRSMCFGHLDVDMNAGGPTSREPVENVYWPRDRAPRGVYRIFVHHFARHDPGEDQTPFEVHVLVDGVRRTHTGTVSGGDPPLVVAEFERAVAVRDDRGTAQDDEFRE